VAHIPFNVTLSLILSEIQVAGGHFNPTPSPVFDPGNRTVASTLRLWPGLAASFLGKREAGR